MELTTQEGFRGKGSPEVRREGDKGWTGLAMVQGMGSGPGSTVMVAKPTSL